MIALAKTAEPVPGAAITIAIGEAGVDHDAVVYSSRTGTSLRSRREPHRNCRRRLLSSARSPAMFRWGGIAMLTKISGGEIVDPVNGRLGKGDLWIRDEKIVEPPAGGNADRTFDASGCIVMAGAIDIHSHIGGGNVNTARLLLPEQHAAHQARPAATPLSNAGWSTFETGCLYAKMGFTTVVEPAMSPGAALHTHLELADIPIIDKATLAILGNDDFLLSMIRDDASPQMIEDYVAWTVGSTRALGVKVINAGAAAAFKENVRTFSLDDVVPSYGVSSRRIVKTLQAAVERLGIPHPLHVHCNNLGAPGAADTAAATIAAAEGAPLHLAHLQFYGYGTEGKRKFSSAAARLAELVNATPEVTIDIGQVMFGQTVTISSDVMRQFSARGSAHPKKTVIHDGDGNGGGIVPFRYRQDFYGTVQWAVGLELFLLIDDPWRVFFTTDHPNGAPFTAYPELFELLMSRDARNEMAAGAFEAAHGALDAFFDRPRIHVRGDRDHDAGRPGETARARRPRPSRAGRDRRCRGLPEGQGHRQNARGGGAGLQERRSRRQGRRDHSLSLGQGAQARSAAGQGDGAAAQRISRAALRPVARLVHFPGFRDRARTAIR